MNKFVRTTVRLINPIREDGTRVEGEAEGMVIKVEHTAPNSIRVDFPSFLALVRELEYLQTFYKTHTGFKDIPQPVWESFQVQDMNHPEDPDRKFYGFRAPLQGEIKWPPKEEDDEGSSL